MILLPKDFKLDGFFYIVKSSWTVDVKRIFTNQEFIEYTSIVSAKVLEQS